MPGRNLNINFVSGEATRIHYGFMLAAGACAINRRVTLFFTMEGLEALQGRLEDIEELIEACVELGARFLVCETGLSAMNMTLTDLRHDLPLEISGVVGMLNAEGGDAEIIVI